MKNVIIGSNGRLGRSLCKVDPDSICFNERLEEENDCLEFIESLEEPSTIWCCIGITNVQGKRQEKEWRIYNGWVPIWLSKYAEEYGHTFIHFSTDYVFQKPSRFNFQLSPYTISKKYMEDMFRDGKGHSKHKNTTVLRVANLFSSDEKDTHNMVQKFKRKIQNGEKIVVDPRIKVYPTHVNVLANWLMENRDSLVKEGLEFKNLGPKPLYLTEFLQEVFSYKYPEQKVGFIEPWHIEFEKERIQVDPTGESIKLAKLLA